MIDGSAGMDASEVREKKRPDFVSLV